jgi:Protein kinase domain
MSGDQLRELLTSKSPDAEALDELARRVEGDESLRAEIESVAGRAEFETHLKLLARSAPPMPPGVSAFVERLASHPPEAPVPSQAETFTELGHYTELTPIGRGGMGTVYRAFDSRLRRAVALKTLSPALSASAEARDRFQREARAAAALDHPNILPIHAIETIEGRDVLVLPLNDGGNLDAIIRRDGPLPLDELIRIGAAVADGLAAAHAAGIVHRDIKPANILLSADRAEVRIADFGLARIADDPALTRDTALAGTPHFLSPEQARGTVADARSDIFSLGATLYFAATARLPFPGDDTPSVLHAVMHDAHAPADNVPEWLGAILDAMLEKNPARRPASADEIATALRTRSSRWSRRKWQRPALRAAAVLGMAAGAAFAFTKWRDARDAEAGRRLATAEREAATPFIISGSASARFAAIGDALAAMRNGDTLTIESGGIHTVKTHRFGNRCATIRGAKNRGVLLTPAGRAEVIFSTAARLRLENLTILHPAGTGEPAPMIVADEGSTVSFDRCRLMTPPSRVRGLTLGSSTTPMIKARTPASIEASRSIITARRSSLVDFSGAGGKGTVALAQCGIGINALFRIRQAATGSVDLSLRNCTVSAGMLALLDGEVPRVTATGSQCFFNLFDAPIRAPGLGEGDVMRMLSWRGEGNAWQFSGGLINFSHEADVRSAAIPGITTLDQLRRLFPGAEAGSFETTETMRDRLSVRRVNPSFIQPDDFALPPGVAKRAPHIGVQGSDIGPE